MPFNVALFEILFILSLLLAFPILFLDVDGAIEKYGFPSVAAPIVGLFAVFIALVLLASRGRKNWARWILLVMLLVGLPFFVLNSPTLLWRVPASAGSPR